VLFPVAIRSGNRTPTRESEREREATWDPATMSFKQASAAESSGGGSKFQKLWARAMPLSSPSSKSAASSRSHSPHSQLGTPAIEGIKVVMGGIVGMVRFCNFLSPY
jgi:hypothetical protein